MKSEYYSEETYNYFNNLNKNRDALLAELNLFLDNNKDLFYTYNITYSNKDLSNKCSISNTPCRETGEEFKKWISSDNDTVIVKSLFLSLDTTNSLMPNHNMRTIDNRIMLWEDCQDFDHHFNLLNKLTHCPLRYGLAITFIKPNTCITLDSSEKLSKPYLFNRMFLLNDSKLCFIHNKNEYFLSESKRNFIHYNQIKFTIKNISDKTAIFVGAGYFMFNYDIKNYFYTKMNLNYQSPRINTFYNYY